MKKKVKAGISSKSDVEETEKAAIRAFRERRDIQDVEEDKVDGVAVVVHGGHGNVASAEYRADDAGDGSKIVAVHEVIEAGKDGGVMTTGTAIDYPK